MVQPNLCTRLFYNHFILHLALFICQSIIHLFHVYLYKYNKNSSQLFLSNAPCTMCCAKLFILKISMEEAPHYPHRGD